MQEKIFCSSYIDKGVNFLVENKQKVRSVCNMAFEGSWKISTFHLKTCLRFGKIPQIVCAKVQTDRECMKQKIYHSHTSFFFTYFILLEYILFNHCHGLAFSHSGLKIVRCKSHIVLALMFKVQDHTT